MILNKIDDPRDNLEKAHRMELVKFARAHGLNHISEQMPAILIRQELRSRNLTNIRIPPRPLGAQSHPPAMADAAQPQNVVQVNAAADLARQYASQLPQQASPPPPPKQNGRFKRLVERPKSEINQLRDQCKALGIKMGRRDNMAILKAKIEAHGQNPA